jgi:hypothetical protein
VINPDGIDGDYSDLFQPYAPSLSGSHNDIIFGERVEISITAYDGTGQVGITFAEGVRSATIWMPPEALVRALDVAIDAFRGAP